MIITKKVRFNLLKQTMNNVIQNFSFKNFILITCSLCLMLATPLAQAMSVQEHYHQKLHELRKNLLFLQRDYKKNKNKMLRNQRRLKLAQDIVDYNQNSMHQIHPDDILPSYIPDDVAELHFGNVYLLNILHNDEYSNLIMKCMIHLYCHYHEKNLNQFWLHTLSPSCKENSSVNNFVVSLLQKQKEELETNIVYLSNKKFEVIDLIMVALPGTLATIILLFNTGIEKNKNNQARGQMAFVAFWIAFFMVLIKVFDLSEQLQEKKALEEQLRNTKHMLEKFKTTKPKKVSYKELMLSKKYFENLYYRAKKYVHEHAEDRHFKNYIFENRNRSSLDSCAEYLYAQSLCIQEFIKHEDPDYFKLVDLQK